MKRCLHPCLPTPVKRTKVKNPQFSSRVSKAAGGYFAGYDNWGWNVVTATPRDCASAVGDLSQHCFCHRASVYCNIVHPNVRAEILLSRDSNGLIVLRLDGAPDTVDYSLCRFIATIKLTFKLKYLL